MPMNQQPYVMPKIISSDPVLYDCQYCGTRGITLTTKKAGCVTFAASGILCVLGLGLCSPIPFCVDESKDTVHSCHRCGNVLQVVRRYDAI